MRSVDATIVNLSLLLISPASFRDVLAGEVYDRVKAFQARSVNLSAIRMPLDLVGSR